jgi:hypothetical protein
MSNGLDGRHRDANGRISEKHGNTTVATIRKIYGDGALEGWRSDAHLETVREETGKSLTQLIHNPEHRDN